MGKPFQRKDRAKNPKSEHVFCHEDGTKILDIRKCFWTALKKSGIKDFHFHDLRHTFASQMVMSGIDLNTVFENSSREALSQDKGLHTLTTLRL